MSIGARIRAAREQIGLSQAQLARSLGITRSACSQWEASDGTAPKRERLEQIAQLLGVSYEWLATGRSGPESAVGEPPARYASGLTAEQREMVELFDALSHDSRRSLLDFLRALQTARPVAGAGAGNPSSPPDEGNG